MCANQKKVLYAATVIDSDTTTTSPVLLSNVALPFNANQFSAVSTVSARTDGTFTTTIEHSPDKTNWFTLVACAAQSANGSVEGTVASTKTVFPYLRASILSASTTDGATVAVTMYFGRDN